MSNATVAISKDSTTTVEAHENAVEAEAVPIVAPHSVEDVDMDVEMEVEDESSVLNGARLDQSIPPGTLCKRTLGASTGHTSSGLFSGLFYIWLLVI